MSRIYRYSPFTHIPGAVGLLGTVEARALEEWGLEEYLSSIYGGGLYVLKEYVNGKPTGRKLRVEIAGYPFPVSPRSSNYSAAMVSAFSDSQAVSLSCGSDLL